MNRLACVLVLTVPLAAQASFRTTRHAGLPTILIGDKFASGDLDGDGDIDLFVANDNSANQLLLNDGYGRFTDATAGRFVMQPGANASHSVDLADIDGDGDLDILIGNDDNLSNRVYVNNGAGFFTDMTATALPVNLHFTEHQVVADFDGDGDVDWFTVDGGPCHYYRNNGAGVFTDVSATVLAGLAPISGSRFEQTPRAADADGDGDLDILLPGPVLLINQINQTGVFVRSTALPAVTGTTNWFADLDGDGDQDILVNYASTILQNQGNGTFVNVTTTAFPGAHSAAMACIDADLDGDLDLVTSTVLWLNNGSGVFVAQATATTLSFGYRLGFAAADFDGDGDIDLPGRPNFLRQVNAVTAPVRGQSYAVDFHARANSMMIACAAFGASVTPAGPFGVLRLDPATMVTLGFLNVTTSPATMTWSLPANPGLVGLQLNYQALIGDPVNGVRLSNAIRDVVQ